MGWPKALSLLMGRVGEAKALREGGGPKWFQWGNLEYQLDLCFFLPATDLCSKRMPNTLFIIWSREDKLKCAGVGNTSRERIYFSPSQEFEIFLLPSFSSSLLSSGVLSASLGLTSGRERQSGS